MNNLPMACRYSYKSYAKQEFCSDEFVLREAAIQNKIKINAQRVLYGTSIVSLVSTINTINTNFSIITRPPRVIIF